MKKIQLFNEFVNEKVIMPSDFTNLERELRYFLVRGPVSRETANGIANKYNVYFLSYDEFYEGLPERSKHTAPPKGVIFGYIGEDLTIRIVTPRPSISIMDLPFIHHMIQHESIHVGQWQRKSKDLVFEYPDPKDRAEYYSNKDEIMAFSQSIIEMMMSQNRLRSLEDLRMALETNPLWNNIKRVVPDEIKQRYLKYIYEYATNYLPE